MKLIRWQSVYLFTLYQRISTGIEELKRVKKIAFVIKCFLWEKINFADDIGVNCTSLEIVRAIYFTQNYFLKRSSTDDWL